MLHSTGPSSIFGQENPAGHVLHSVDFVLSEYVPFKHIIAECISLNGHLNPLVQLLHLVSPTLEYVPGVHSTGDTDLLRQLFKRKIKSYSS